MNTKTLLSLLALLALPAVSSEPRPDPKPSPVDKPIIKKEPEAPKSAPTAPPAAGEVKEKPVTAERMELRTDAGTPAPTKKK